MDRETILAEIKRTARDGKALGRDAFTKETGISERAWSGRFWARWSDAVREAGLEARTMQGAHAQDFVFDRLLELTRRLGRFPTVPEMDMERIQDSSFPSSRSITRRWDRKSMFDGLIAYALKNDQWADLVEILQRATPQGANEIEQADPGPQDYGHVYLIKSGKVYKVGSSRAVYSRTATVVRQSPLGGELIHTISTDDPEGIERYWHERFGSSRINGSNKMSGEWFSLSAADVAAFKRRKTM